MIITIMGPSASGKTVIGAALKQECNYQDIVSYTTRPPRPGETDGVDYHFISKEQFLKMQKENGFVESVEYNGNFYGTGVKEAREAAQSQTPYLIVVTPEGAGQIAEIVGKENVFSVYVDAPVSVRAKRYIDREGDTLTPEQLKKFADRMIEDAKIFAGVKETADYCIVNDEEVSIEKEEILMGAFAIEIDSAMLQREEDRAKEYEDKE